MAHHRTYFHSQHLRSPFRNLYSHLSLSLVPRLSLSPPSASLGSTLHLSIPDPQSAFSLSHTASLCTISLSPQLTQTNHLAWAVPFQPPFSIPDLHTHPHTALWAVPFQPPFSIPDLHSSHTALWAVPFQPPFSIPDLHSLAHCPLGQIILLGPFPSGFHFHSPISDLVPDDGARATTFAEAQRWQEV